MCITRHRGLVGILNDKKPACWHLAQFTITWNNLNCLRVNTAKHDDVGSSTRGTTKAAGFSTRKSDDHD